MNFHFYPFNEKKKQQTHPRNALDVGCAVGRTCFELSKMFDSVVGIDYSANFIKQCNRIMTEKEVNYICKTDGNLLQRLKAKLDPDIDTSKLKFEVGDACNLRADLGEYNLVIASNLICRLSEPMKFINRLKDLVKPNGYVILSTPFTWMSEFTPKVKNLINSAQNTKIISFIQFFHRTTGLVAM